MTTQTKIKESPKSQRSPEAFPAYEAKDYAHLLGMKGFSEKLLKDHFKLYEGYVKNTNESLEKISFLQQKENQAKELSEIRRRFGWEFNGMRLHEFYFDNLGGQDVLRSNNSLSSLINSNFGSQAQWEKDFVAAGTMRGIGWVILYQDVQTGRLFNTWIEEHQTNHLAGGQPLLVLDVFEHAYTADYGTDKGKYIEAFLNNINWDVVSRRQRIELVDLI